MFCCFLITKAELSSCDNGFVSLYRKCLPTIMLNRYLHNNSFKLSHERGVKIQFKMLYKLTIKLWI